MPHWFVPHWCQAIVGRDGACAVPDDPGLFVAGVVDAVVVDVDDFAFVVGLLPEHAAIVNAKVAAVRIRRARRVDPGRSTPGS